MNILFLPFFSGLGSPYWVSDAQAAIVGLTRDSGNSELARACLEGICLSINDLMESFEKDSGHKVKELRVDGGAVGTVTKRLMMIASLRPKGRLKALNKIKGVSKDKKTIKIVIADKPAKSLRLLRAASPSRPASRIWMKRMRIHWGSRSPTANDSLRSR